MLQIKIYIESLGLDMTDRGLRRERDLVAGAGPQKTVVAEE